MLNFLKNFRLNAFEATTILVSMLMFPIVERTCNKLSFCSHVSRFSESVNNLEKKLLLLLFIWLILWIQRSDF